MTTDELVPPGSGGPATRSESRYGVSTWGAPLAPAVLAVLALLAATLWAVGSLTAQVWVQAPAAAWFVVLGVGSAPWQPVRRLQPLTRWALSALVGLSVLALAPTAAVTLGTWHPGLLLALVGVPAVAVHVHHLATGGATVLRDAATRLSPAVQARRAPPAVWLSVAGAALALATAWSHRGLVPGYFGYLVEVGPPWYAGLALVLAAVAVLPRTSAATGWFVTTVLTGVLTLTPALVYDLPRSASTAKHVALVEQVLATGQVSSSVAVYNAWPGFFAAAAWLCDVGGVQDPFQLAQWWAPALGVLRVLALGQLVARAGVAPRWTWSAVALAVLADAIGADYFSPQSLGFVLALLVLGLLLRPSAGPSWGRDAVLLGATAIAVSHQLTPFVLAGVAVVLVLGRVTRPGDAACVLVPALVWTGAHLGSLDGFVSLADIGSLTNFRPPQTEATSGLERSPVISASVVALLAGGVALGLVALRGLFARPLAPRWFAVAAAPSVGLVLVAVNPYGNEGIFRAMLFSLPWLGLLAARGLAAMRRPLLVLAPALALTAGSFLVASSALDPVYVIRGGDLTAYRTVAAAAAAAPERDVVVLALGDGDLPGSLPTTTGGALPLTREDIDDPVAQTDESPQQEAAGVVAGLAGYLGPTSGADVYAVWSPVSRTYDDAYAVQTAAQFDALRDALSVSPSWQVVLVADGTVLFRLRDGALAGAAA